jgi:hypothetical protein
MFIPATETTPLVKYNNEDLTLEIIGRSIPEDAFSFYEPVLNLLQDVEQHYPKTIKAVFQLEYFNTHSSRRLLDIFRKLDEIKSTGTLTKIFWVCDEEDREMVYHGEDLRNLVNVAIEITELPENKYDELMHRAMSQAKHIL